MIYYIMTGIFYGLWYCVAHGETELFVYITVPLVGLVIGLFLSLIDSQMQAMRLQLENNPVTVCRFVYLSCIAGTIVILLFVIHFIVTGAILWL